MPAYDYGPYGPIPYGPGPGVLGDPPDAGPAPTPITWPWPGPAWNDVGCYAPPATYDGPTVVHALQAWWAAQRTLHALISPPVPDPDDEDGDPIQPDVPLWHLEADRPTPPYVVCFLASEAEYEARCTKWTTLEAVVQVNVHAETDHQALMIRKAIRAAVLDAPLSVDGLAVRHVLPGAQGIQVGQGFLKGGADSWMATLEIEVVYETDVQP